MSIATIDIPLHGAHVGAPKFIPIALEPHIIHSRFNHNARFRGLSSESIDRFYNRQPANRIFF
jgi:hypothetical protein